ncbi:MAG: guanylate kinase [Desulfobulbaceae bacterium]|uniref:Guanylate kinase n=1 Tax=Candidatus Desulfobia pelagia TaxID=2841692 RepID=A0A8J6NAV0_9BACT|nr:guanylate kinase [Candidatus Desulfobia pelagia]
MKGSLLIISAPSGTGKTTILKKLMSDIEGTVFSVSHTTRSPRSGEQNGIDYHFVERDIFQKMCADDEFLEWAEVHGNFYGTSKTEITRQLNDGLDVFLDIDVQGARQVRSSEDLQSTSVFIIPPSWQEQENRLLKRGTDSKEIIELRLANARKEMSDAPSYDYLVVNDSLDKAVEALKSIIIAERSRQRRGPEGKPLSMPPMS